MIRSKIAKLHIPRGVLAYHYPSSVAELGCEEPATTVPLRGRIEGRMLGERRRREGEGGGAGADGDGEDVAIAVKYSRE